MLLDNGPDGAWAADALQDTTLVAPSLVAFETANIIRRCALAQRVSADLAAQAHADLLDLRIEPWPYEIVAARAWELRRNLSIYDASYVAVAEANGASLVTLDRGIAAAPGVRCAVLTPPHTP